MQAKYITKATDLAKLFIGKVINPGDIVVDATVGNGKDTLFLAELVNESGKVFGFDIQKIALENTYKKLTTSNCQSWVELIHDGHENIDKYVTTKVNAIMFNLGYLPGKNHEITTIYTTTITAIQKGLELLQKNGIITISIYPGHKEGQREKEEILALLCDLNQLDFDVLKLEFINQINNPPLLIVIEKK